MVNVETLNKIAELKQKINELEQSLVKPVKTKEELEKELEEEFLSLINNSKYVIEGSEVFWYDKDDIWLINQKKDTKEIWFNYWNKFDLKYKMNIDDIMIFFHNFTTNHFDLINYTCKY